MRIRNGTDADETTFEAKRRGRDGVDPETLPGEFLDEMRMNRFTPPPDPQEKEGTG